MPINSSPFSSNVPPHSTSDDFEPDFNSSRPHIKPPEYDTDRLHQWITFTCMHCGQTIKVPRKCGDRFCSVCMKRRRMDTMRRIQHLGSSIKLEKYQTFKMLTLTIKNDTDLERQVCDLIKGFRKLRNSKIWKETVTGGCYIIECKMGQQGWHAHFHIILQSYWIDLKRLRSAWKKSSGGTHLNLIPIATAHVAKYVTKYVTKSNNVEQGSDPANVLKGRRLFQPFGSWYAICRSYKPPPFRQTCPTCDQPSDWHCEDWTGWFRNTG